VLGRDILVLIIASQTLFLLLFILHENNTKSVLCSNILQIAAA
jgi:hypothetical protein